MDLCMLRRLVQVFDSKVVSIIIVLVLVYHVVHLSGDLVARDGGVTQLHKACKLRRFPVTIHFIFLHDFKPNEGY